MRMAVRHEPLKAIGLNEALVALSLSITLIIMPILFFDMPGMVDYPNHLARMYLLTDGPAHPGSKFYEIKWFLNPNLAMDIIVPTLGRIIGVEPATRLFTVVSLILVMTGPAAIEYAIRRRIGWGPLLSLLFTYNAVFLLGFLNFIFAFGLALWSVAGWIGLRRSGSAAWVVLHLLALPVLFISHLHGFAIYLVVVGAYELWRLRYQRPGPVDLTVTLVLLSAPLPLAYLAMALGEDHNSGSDLVWDFPLKARLLATLAGGYDPRIAVVKLVGAVVLVLWAARRKTLRAHPAAPWIAVSLVTAFLIMPHGIMGSFFGDIRFMVAALFVLPAFFTWDEKSAAACKAAGAGFGAILVVSVANVAWAWAYLQTDYDEIRGSFALVELQSKILLGRPSAETRFSWVQRSLLHAPTLAVADRGAFVPTLFTWPGGQVIRPRPEYSAIDIMEGWPVPVADLMNALHGTLPQDPSDPSKPIYWRNWTADFDYLYIMYPTDDRFNPLPGTLIPVTSGREFLLYRIAKPVS
jgi:hypothetical protein